MGGGGSQELIWKIVWEKKILKKGHLACENFPAWFNPELSPWRILHHMMNLRWKIFHFMHEFQEDEQKGIKACGSCFAKLALEGYTD